MIKPKYHYKNQFSLPIHLIMENSVIKITSFSAFLVHPTFILPNILENFVLSRWPHLISSIFSFSSPSVPPQMNVIEKTLLNSFLAPFRTKIQTFIFAIIERKVFNLLF